MYRQIAGKRRSRRKSIRKVSKKRSNKRSRVLKRRSKCNSKRSRKSCRRKSKGKNKCSWVKRKSSGRRKHTAYCRRMSGGATPQTESIKDKLIKKLREIDSYRRTDQVPYILKIHLSNKFGDTVTWGMVYDAMDVMPDIDTFLRNCIDTIDRLKDTKINTAGIDSANTGELIKLIRFFVLACGNLLVPTYGSVLYDNEREAANSDSIDSSDKALVAAALNMRRSGDCSNQCSVSSGNSSDGSGQSSQAS